MKHKTCLTNQWDGWQEHFVVKTGSLATEERRSAEQTRWLGCWLGHGGAARRWRLSAEARGSVAREAGARGAVACEAGARGAAAGSAAAARLGRGTQARARGEARGGGGAMVRQLGLGHGGGLG